MTSMTLTVQEDPETKDLYLVLPPSFCLEQDWQAGDILEYVLGDTDSFTIINRSKNERTAQQDMPLFIVETLVTHRVQYAVRAKCLEDAKDTITMNEAHEFDQNHVGTDIFSARPVSEQEYLGSFSYPISDSHKRRLIHRTDYSK